MKKRIVCALLTLVLLVGLVPVTASAADNKISESAITVLKQLTPVRFNSQNKIECYRESGKTYRIGYGTVCTEKHSFDTSGNPIVDKNKHTISQDQADKALRSYLAELDKAVNSFASQNGLSLKQNQHDALVVFSHGAGTAWMSGTGALKSAIVNKAGANELLNIMDSLNDGSYSRHQVEVNMYVSGQYSNTIPKNYATVIYDANTGRISQGDGQTYILRYDTSKTLDHINATKSGAIFLGWYTELNGGKWMPKLTSACAGKTLYAHWQVGYKSAEAANYTLTTGELVSTTVYVNAEPNAKVLKDSKGNEVKVSGKVTITQDFIDSKGTRWGYVEAKKGWVKVGTPAAESLGKDVIATATVTYNGYLNVRSTAGTDGKIVGAMGKDETVNLYEIKTVNGHRWGKCDAGWICLTYTTVNMVDGKTVSDEGVAAYAFTGKVSGADIDAYTAPGDSSAKIAFKDAKNNVYKYIPNKTAITISNLSVAQFGTGNATWAKVNWKNNEQDKDGKKITVNRSAWIPLSMEGSVLGDKKNFNVVLDPVMYTVVCDTTNAREAAGDQNKLAFTLNKGTEVEVKSICLVGENMWGYITVLQAVSTGSKTPVERNGWINLASKYVKRSSEVTLEVEEEKKDEYDTGLIATVIDTDSVKVRKTGGLYGAVIGSLNRGTTVRVWESKKNEWYKLDTNQNGVYDYKEDGWVSAKYLNVRKGTIGGTQTVTDAGGNKVTTDGSGTGVVANTYSGVNVRQGAGIGYGVVGKLLPGTTVQILEVKQGGAAKWGRTDKGWVCMDYISMVSYNPAPTEPEPEDPSKGTAVADLDKVAKTSTTAVYTGKLINGCTVFKEPIVMDGSDPDALAANTVDTLGAGYEVTIHELASVTQEISSESSAVGDDSTVTTVTKTTYWARINNGWIRDPEKNLELYALDEKVHTVTGSDSLKVRDGNPAPISSSAVITKLMKGEQVKVTALKIEGDKVWGRVETEEGTGWIRLDYTSEGAYYVKPTEPAASTPAPTEPVMGSTGNTGNGGFVTNSSGYRYKGKVINTSAVNVRASASTTAGVTTTLKNGAALVIYETTISENMAWGRCDAGWVYLYYVDLEPCVNGAVDARVVFNDNTVAYSDVNCTTATGTYARMSVVDIYEIVGKMAKTDLGWVNVDNLL